MVSSRSGRRGQTAQSRVEEEIQHVTEVVLILNQNMVDWIVLVRILHAILAMLIRAQVSTKCFTYLFSFI